MQSIDAAAAYRALILGAQGIHGFNHALVGYDSAESLFAVLRSSDRLQLLAVFDLIAGPHQKTRELQALRTVDYGCVVLDLGLPGRDGMSWLGSWRRQDINVHVLILTARDAEKSLIDGLDAGGDDYLIKPVSARELAARRARCMGGATPFPVRVSSAAGAPDDARRAALAERVQALYAATEDQNAFEPRAFAATLETVCSPRSVAKLAGKARHAHRP